MKATIGEALGFTAGSDEVNLLKRRIDTLNKKMMDLVSSNAQSGGDFESCESEFKEISGQIGQLKSHIETIEKANCSNKEYKNRLNEIQRIIDKRETNIDTYDNSIVRQMIECIKVFSDGRLEIYF